MATQALPLVSPEEYLALDRAAERRSEYVEGRMYLMAGASDEHILIVNNVSVELSIQTRGKCRVGVNDLRLFVPNRSSYFYPDVVVSCARFEVVGDRRDIFVNPKVVVEVISKSSGDYDRTVKFSHYRTIPSLNDYLIVDQFHTLAEHYSRQPDGSWIFREHNSLDAVISFPSIAAGLKMSEIYRDIEFTQP